jgi:hydroxymethylbilane synthase
VKPLRIATRRSPLALTQAERVVDALRAQDPQQELRIVQVETAGDRDRKTHLSDMQGVGMFTAEIERALLRGECDLAVHSYKDLATVSPRELMIGAVLRRDDPSDAWISRTATPFGRLPHGAVIGTSSLRRAALIRHLRPDVKVTNLRGNVHTRLAVAGVLAGNASLSKPRLDGTLLSMAGLQRLSLEHVVTEKLDTEVFLPAPAQGTIVVQIRSADRTLRERLVVLHHRETDRETTAERAFLREMEGGCRLPIGAIARTQGDALRLSAIVLSTDGKRAVSDTLTGVDPESLGATLARMLRERGGRDILDEIQKSGPHHRGPLRSGNPRK